MNFKVYFSIYRTKFKKKSSNKKNKGTNNNLQNTTQKNEIEHQKNNGGEHVWSGRVAVPVLLVATDVLLLTGTSCVYLILSLFILLSTFFWSLLAILSVLLRFTASDYPFSISKLFLYQYICTYLRFYRNEKMMIGFY